MLYIPVPFSCNFYLHCVIVFAFTVHSIGSISILYFIGYVTNLALWLQDFNKLSYVLTSLTGSST